MFHSSKQCIYYRKKYFYVSVFIKIAGLGGSVGCASDWFDLRRVGSILSLRFDHEIFSTGTRSLPLIQEGQLSVSGERMCTILVNRLEDCLPSKSVVK